MPRAKLPSGDREGSPSGTLAPLRRRHGHGEEPYAVYRLAVELPKGAIGAVFSRAHPELRIELENRVEVEPGIVLWDVRGFGPRAADWSEEIRKFPDIVNVEVHEEGPETAMYRITQRTPLILKVLQHHRILAQYPIALKDGWMRFETLAKASQVRALLRELTQRVGPNRVEAVRRGPVLARTLGLTAPQDALFRAALAAGYFSVPRGISVSDLAEKLGRSKSNTSEMLSKIQRRLAESAVQLDLVPLFSAP